MKMRKSRFFSLTEIGLDDDVMLYVSFYWLLLIAMTAAVDDHFFVVSGDKTAKL